MKKKTLFIALIAVVSTSLIAKNLIKTKEKRDGFNISASGAWVGKKSAEHHYYDESLANSLYQFFKDNNATSIVDLGAGQGKYSQYLIENGIFSTCYDGNLDTQTLSDGRCAVINLSSPINFAKSDWVLSLEVGEHLPKEFEDIFISNLDKMNIKGIVLSWAIQGQDGDGHVNEQSNDYIKQKLLNLGYTNDVEAEQELRKNSTAHWFKNTIMVFRKPE